MASIALSAVLALMAATGWSLCLGWVLARTVDADL